MKKVVSLVFVAIIAMSLLLCNSAAAEATHAVHANVPAIKYETTVLSNENAIRTICREYIGYSPIVFREDGIIWICLNNNQLFKFEDLSPQASHAVIAANEFTDFLSNNFENLTYPWFDTNIGEGRSFVAASYATQLMSEYLGYDIAIELYLENYSKLMLCADNISLQVTDYDVKFGDDNIFMISTELMSEIAYLLEQQI